MSPPRPLRKPLCPHLFTKSCSRLTRKWMFQQSEAVLLGMRALLNPFLPNPSLIVAHYRNKRAKCSYSWLGSSFKYSPRVFSGQKVFNAQMQRSHLNSKSFKIVCGDRFFCSHYDFKQTSSASLPKTPRLVTTITRLVFFTSSFLTFNKNHFSTLSNQLISTAMKLFLNLSNSKVDCHRFPKNKKTRP